MPSWPRFRSSWLRRYPEDKTKALEAVSLQEQIVGKIRPVLRLLMGAVAVVLLIVCANITHLQLVRATRLRREVTIRTALGASRWTLASARGSRCCCWRLRGCAAGVLVALPALKLLVELAPQEIPRLGDVRLNFDVILFSFLISLAAMAVTALLPLWRAWQVDPASAMKQDAARGTESRGSGQAAAGADCGRGGVDADVERGGDAAGAAADCASRSRIWDFRRRSWWCWIRMMRAMCCRC